MAKRKEECKEAKKRLRRNPRKRILLHDILCHPWMDELHYNSAKPSQEIKKLDRKKKEMMIISRNFKYQKRIIITKSCKELDER